MRPVWRRRLFGALNLNVHWTGSLCWRSKLLPLSERTRGSNALTVCKFRAPIYPTRRHLNTILAHVNPERSLTAVFVCRYGRSRFNIMLMILFAVVGRFDLKQWKVLLYLPYSLTLVSTSRSQRVSFCFNRHPTPWLSKQCEPLCFIFNAV